MCAACWSHLTFLGGPSCPVCAYPFPIDLQQESENPICGGCLKAPPPFDLGRAPLLYDMASKDLILRFKHGDALHLTPAFAKWMLRSGEDILTKTDYIAPVPLHWTRLLKRNYNQAALLASSIARQKSIPFLPTLLTRIRATPPQGKLGTAERFQNVRHAFGLNKKYSNLINKKVITLVDDVYTSGATLKECANILKKEGAATVYILTLARVAPL